MYVPSQQTHGMYARQEKSVLISFFYISVRLVDGSRTFSFTSRTIIDPFLLPFAQNLITEA